MSWFSKSAEPPARYFTGSATELSSMGRKGFGGGTGGLPGISSTESDLLVMTAYERAGYPSPGTPEGESFVSQFMSELEGEAAEGDGWAFVAGAFVAANFLPDGASSNNPAYRRILRAAAQFLIDQNVRGPALPMFLVQEMVELDETSYGSDDRGGAGGIRHFM